MTPRVCHIERLSVICGGIVSDTPSPHLTFGIGMNPIWRMKRYVPVSHKHATIKFNKQFDCGNCEEASSKVNSRFF